MNKTGSWIIVSGAIVLMLQGQPPASGHRSAAPDGRQATYSQMPKALAGLERSRKAAVKADLNFGRMPLYFIANRGQEDERVGFSVQGQDKTLYFGEDGVTFVLTEPRKGKGSERWVAKLSFVGAKNVDPVGENQQEAAVSYFRGKPGDWKTGVPTYSRIVYKELWPGIDLVYSGTWNTLKYEFIVRPGADPARVRLSYQGISRLSVGDDGALKVTTPAGAFQDAAPTAYQEIAGKRVGVPLAYQLDEAREGLKPESNAGPKSANVDGLQAGGSPRAYSFRVGAYDPTRPLILDPTVLIYCGYVGGSATESAFGIALDSAANVYITGGTISTEATFPVTVGPGSAQGGGEDAFVAKINSSGTALIYCGYIGGAADDRGLSIAVDSDGNAYVTGYAVSTEATFPVTVGPDLSHNGNWDAFVAKVGAAGTGLIYCGYIGGAGQDQASGIAVNSSGAAYVAGETSSTEATFPVKTGPDLTHNGSGDAFIAKVGPTGTGLAFCGYIGGSANERAFDVALDVSGNAYVVGQTLSSETTFPVFIGPDLTYNGSYDVFIAKVNSTGIGLGYCGYIGGSDADLASGVAVDAAGAAYVTGYTKSAEGTFPALVGPDLTFNGGTDAFAAKVDPSGADLVYCGYVGGSGQDTGEGIAVDSSGAAYIAGETYSSEMTFPVKDGPDLTHNGSGDAFVAKLVPNGSSFIYCGYVGGSGTEYGSDIAIDRSGNAYVCGMVTSSQATFPVAAGPDLTFNGVSDAFVAKVSLEPIDKPRHAVGDFDGDGLDETAVDFGANGLWEYDNGAWSKLTANNPEELFAADTDGDNIAEVLADLGVLGLWEWKAGTWSQLAAMNPELLAAGDTSGDAADEVVADFGPAGLWSWKAGGWSEISNADATCLAVGHVSVGKYEKIIAGFGPLGIWIWNSGSWSELSGVSAESLAIGDIDGAGGRDVIGDFGGVGMWAWASGAWTELSGADADFALALDANLGGGQEIAGDFGPLGLWLWSDGSWTQLSAVNPDFMIRADIAGIADEELSTDFGNLGLWTWSSGGGWIQLTGVNAEYLFAGDFTGDSKREIMADFGSLGLWMWSAGAWTQVSPLNAD